MSGDELPDVWVAKDGSVWNKKLAADLSPDDHVWLNRGVADEADVVSVVPAFDQPGRVDIQFRFSLGWSRGFCYDADHAFLVKQVT